MSVIRQILLMALLICGLGAASAQEADLTNQLSQELVSARIQILRDSGNQEGAETILGSYQAVFNWLGEAEVHAASEKTYLQAPIDAPLQEAEIRDRMESTQYRSPDINEASVERLSKENLDSKLAELRSNLRDNQTAKTLLDEKIVTEQSSAPNIQARFEAIDDRLQELPPTTITIEPDLQPSQFEATQWTALAERKALNAEKRALQSQLASQSVRYSRRQAESAELALIVDGLNYEIDILEKELASRAQIQEAESHIDLDENTPGYSIVQQLIDENTQLREKRAELDQTLATLKEENEQIEQQLSSLNDRFEGVKTLVSLASNSASLGHVLMVHWHQTDSFNIDGSTSISGVIGDHVIQRTRYEDAMNQLTQNPKESLNQYLLDVGGSESDIDKKVVETGKALVRSKRELLTALIANETELVNQHGSQERNRLNLNQQLEEYREYLGSRILWVPSHPVLTLDVLKNIKQEFVNFVSKLSELRMRKLTPATTTGLFLVLILLALRRYIDSLLRTINKKVGRVREDSIRYTFQALLLNIVRLTPAPLLLLLLAFNLQSPNSDTAPYLATGLQDSIQDLLLLLLMRTACLDFGIARTHFAWSKGFCQELRQLSNRLLIWWFPLLVLTGFIFRVEINSINAILGRLLFCAVMIIFSFILLRFLASELEILKNRRRWRFWLMVVVVINGVFFIATTALGYLYTAKTVYAAVVSSLIMVVVLLFFYFTMKRWLLVVQRRLRFKELLAARQALGENDSPEVQPEEITLVSLGESVSNLLKVGTLTIGAFWYLYIWAPLFRALEAMQRITLWTINDRADGEAILTSITLASVVLAFLIGVFTVIAARNVPPLLDLVLRSRKDSTPGTRYAMVKLLGYLIISIGTLAFLSTLGLRWDRLQWLVAALGVGIGFGLQEIIANFISGLIILFERPIRVGDVISVGESSGQVIRIKIRATTIRDFDGKELLVPNKEFVTGRLLNWTLSDTSIRMTLDVGIAYGSDVRKAVAILQDLLENHELIADNPPPDVIFNKFDNSALNLTARYFFTDVQQRGVLLSDLHLRINDAFAEAGIVIAFPQLDVHFDADAAGTVTA